MSDERVHWSVMPDAPDPRTLTQTALEHAELQRSFAKDEFFGVTLETGAELLAALAARVQELEAALAEMQRQVVLAIESEGREIQRAEAAERQAAQLREAATAVLDEIARLNEAERIDREAGYPLPGDSALYVYLALGLDERVAELRAALAVGEDEQA